MQWEGARNTAANGEAVRQTPAHAVPRGVRAVTETVGPGRPVHFPREQTGGRRLLLSQTPGRTRVLCEHPKGTG